MTGPGTGTSDLVINRISAPESTRFRASSALSSFWHAIEICALNSLDAGASEVHVEIDAAGSFFKIIDSGIGLSAADMRLLGSWNVSSKCSKEAHQLGTRGEGLAAICSTSVVEITSLAAGSFETYTCLLRAGELLQLKLAPEQRHRSGTIVSVRDMFFNRPVTRKSILHDGGAKKEVEHCRDVISNLSLLRPDVTFTLYDRSSRKFVAKHLRGRSPVQSIAEFFGNPPEPELVHVGNGVNTDVLGDGQSFASDFPANATPRSFQTRQWRVSGWAVRPPFGHPTTSRQRIFINGKVVRVPQLRSTVDDLFSELYRAILKQQGRAPGGEFLTVRKASNLHAMFVLDLRCEPGMTEVLPAPGGGALLVEDWAPVVEAVRHAILDAWKPVLNTALLQEAQQQQFGQIEAEERRTTNIFLGRATPGPSSAPGRLRSRDTNSNRASHAAPSSDIEAFNAFGSPAVSSYSNSTNRQQRQQPWLGGVARQLPPQGLKPTSTANGFGSNISNHQQPSSTRYVAREKEEEALPPLLPPKPPPASVSGPSSSSYSALSKAWRQRRELSVARGPVIASARGSSMSLVGLPVKRPRSAGGDYSNAATGLQRLPLGKDGTMNTNSSINGASNGASFSALDAILSNWENPAMMPAAATGAAGPTATLEGLSSAVFSQLRPETLEKKDLQGARALRQVDFKFIPIVSSGGLIALVDQHAADERVQLEYLKARVVAPTGSPAGGACPSMVLQTPQPLRLGADEIILLEAYGRAAESWGWRWTVYRASASAPEALVEVTAVPVILNRALTATDLRLYLHDLAETRGGASVPVGVTRILNSKACRSAVMFGDDLVPSQCQGIVDALQNTQMCFICAHGRPTTAPLVDLVALGKAVSALKAGRQLLKRNDMDGGGEKGSLRGLKGRLLAELKQ